jgi:catechol 2,3-dioxygenase-like lactoylglutathione lyase family enzyme
MNTMDIRIRRSNTILYCRSWEETVRFYRDGLGLKAVMERDWFVEFRLNNSATLSVADQARASIQSAEGRGMTISLRVDDVVELHNHLTGRGLAPEPLRTVWGSRAFYLHDPEGNRLEFWS